MQMGRDVGVFLGGGGVIPQIPAPTPGWIRLPGEGLCLLSIAGRLSVLFVPSGRDGVCFWGRSASAAAKLAGRYCGRALLDAVAPS